MGLLQNNSNIMLLGEHENQQSRASPRISKRHNDPRNSPHVAKRSVNRSSWHSAQTKGKQFHLADTDCQLSSSEPEDGNHSNKRSRCRRKHSRPCTPETGDNAYKGFNVATETRENMALNAVMMSGAGGLASKRSSSRRDLSDLDNEIPHENGWSPTGDSSNPSSRSESSSPNSAKCICDKLLLAKQTVTINVGGQVFETYKSTLRRLKSCKLANDREMSKYYRVDTGDYFFDRDPFAFNIILNYLRYGDLHLPTNLCGPALMREFEFWGVDEQDIERCCFQPYNTWKTQTKSLEKLEYDRKQSTTQTDLAQDRNSKSLWRRIRAIVWTFLQDPNSSLSAKIYAYISVIFVALSIFSFCAETHPLFQMPPSEVNDLSILYKIFTLEDSSIIKNAKNGHIDNGNGTNILNSTSSNETNEIHEEKTVQHPALLIIDLMCVFFFTLEFLTRLVFCPKKFRFCTSLQNIIDFVAIVPDYVEFIVLSIRPHGHELGFVDFIFILRMLRLCRIFRLIRHVPGLWILLYTLKASFNELMLMFVFLLIGMVMFASLLHFIEGGQTFNNIPVGFWWAVVTMTTVGYGDMFPVTAYGYIIGSICAISGLLMIAFTVPIIVSNFVLYYTHVQYGISDKDFGGSKIHDFSDETETCSYHTTFTETSEDQKALNALKFRKNSQGSNDNSLKRHFANSLRSIRSLRSLRKMDKFDEEKSINSPDLFTNPGSESRPGSKEQVVFVVEHDG